MRRLLAALLLVSCVSGGASLAQPPDKLKLASPSDGGSFAAYLALVEQDQLMEDDELPSPSREIQSIPAPFENAQLDGSAESSSVSRMQAAQDGGSLLEQQQLTIADVIASVYRAYPEVMAARQFLPEAGGQLLQAYGAYDTKLKAHTINEPLGFYSNSRHQIGVARQTWWGGYVSAGYRIGRGRYAPWYLERQTEDGGEIKVSSIQPLLQGRAIDPQRVAVFQASLRQLQTTPRLREIILLVSTEAMILYWDWIAAGAVLEAQQELLELAELRGRQFDLGVKAGYDKPFDQLVNQQLIAERRTAVLDAEQKLQSTSFKLGLYLRGDNGEPLYPNPDWLPGVFPIVQPLG
ncbi:MAG: TolC family protein, partial [Planctomycetota bacterium]